MQPVHLLNLARRLTTYESAGAEDEKPLDGPVERVFDKLRTHLSRRIGQYGYRTLLARALSVATLGYPQLGSVNVAADGSLVALHAPDGAEVTKVPYRARSDSKESSLALLIQLLSLLCSFIGDQLTVRILSAIWPELTLGDANGLENENR